jgi:ADP-ribosylglycohydrolase
LFGGAPIQHAFLGRAGMTSDDTEHACMTAQALLASGGDPERFARSLAWRLRGWVLSMPAGVGLATAQACLKLLMGFPPARSGVRSAGNGPAMRAPIIGMFSRHDIPRLKSLVRASTRLTHTDPAAEHGALAVALAVALGRPDSEAYVQLISQHLVGAPILKLLTNACEHAKAAASLEAFLTTLGLSRGVSGYINHTVPAAIFCWLRWPNDFRFAVEQVILAGGDTDSTAAIVGALVGASAGPDAIPTDWLAGVKDYPRSTSWIRSLAAAMESATPGVPLSPPILFWPAILIRNLVFLVVVLLHGVRRLLPPY